MAEEVIAIEGGHKLNGTVTISGAKNATVALIPSIVLSDEPVEIYNVPEISDVDERLRERALVPLNRMLDFAATLRG